MRTPPVRDGTWLWLVEWARDEQAKTSKRVCGSRDAMGEVEYQRGRWSVYEDILRADRHMLAEMAGE